VTVTGHPSTGQPQQAQSAGGGPGTFKWRPSLGRSQGTQPGLRPAPRARARPGTGVTVRRWMKEIRVAGSRTNSAGDSDHSQARSGRGQRLDKWAARQHCRAVRLARPPGTQSELFILISFFEPMQVLRGRHQVCVRLNANAQACWCLRHCLCFRRRCATLTNRSTHILCCFPPWFLSFVIAYSTCSIRFRAVVFFNPASTPIQPSIMPCSWCEGIPELCPQ
jgi:hypothetical protein